MKIIIKDEKYKVIEFNKTKKEFICKNKTYKLNEIDFIELDKNELANFLKQKNTMFE